MKTTMLTAACVLVLCAPAFADRDPTAEERAAIGAVLAEQGFTGWESIELEDDESKWEVDDAVAGDGKVYDLDLAPGSYEIIRRDED